eukprot:TRINITY_DN10203_c0_g1_i5.p1 TRINITY_DN10203_c0_g1~~TRINITY_DN10203_c0_g1_i5.p1  ORF type:complete len:227 (-),score=25.24 TRINITY_DN10203_c0_g1_i5:22-702(-)
MLNLLPQAKFGKVPSHGCVVKCNVKTTVEISFCTGKTCKKQGSQQMLKFGQQLSLQDVDFTSCGCLGLCGQGPNAVNQTQGEVFTNVNSEEKVMKLAQMATGESLNQTVIDSIRLRVQGNQFAYDGDFKSAIKLYTQAIKLNPESGLHILYSNRSAAKLQSGDKEGAIQDAQLAVQAAPKDWETAHIRLIDALYAVGNFSKALDALKNAGPNPHQRQQAGMTCDQV